MENRKSLINYFFLGLSVLSFSACNTKLYDFFMPKAFLSYHVRNFNDKVPMAIIEENTESYRMLITNRSIVAIGFTQFGNNRYTEISINVSSLEEHRTLKLHKIEFDAEGKTQSITFDKTFVLRQKKKLFTVKESPELSIPVFWDIIANTNKDNNIKIYLQTIFKKTKEDMENQFFLAVRIYYSLDDGAVVSQELKYIVTVYERPPMAPEWMYWLFPGM